MFSNMLYAFKYMTGPAIMNHVSTEKLPTFLSFLYHDSTIYANIGEFSYLISYIEIIDKLNRRMGHSMPNQPKNILTSSDF